MIDFIFCYLLSCIIYFLIYSICAKPLIRISAKNGWIEDQSNSVKIEGCILISVIPFLRGFLLVVLLVSSIFKNE